MDGFHIAGWVWAVGVAIFLVAALWPKSRPIHTHVDTQYDNNGRRIEN
jgi:hypothetical protein